MAEFKSKHGVVSRSPYELYMAFADMRNFVNFLPAEKKEGITAEYDSIRATVQGFPVGVKITERKPYSMISLSDDGAPFGFSASVCFDNIDNDDRKTDFHIEVSADLNFMMKMLVGSKLKEALDKAVDSLVAMSENRA